MRTSFFLRTKPRLSQAGALLLPKDFVSLSIIAKTKRAKVGVTNTNLVHKTNTV